MKNIALIKLAESTGEIEKCYAVLSQLRPHISEKDLIALVQRQQENGYRLAYLEVDEIVQSVAGFYISENFAWQKFLYINDLVTDETSRSQGYGEKLLSWLVEYAKKNSCLQLHLDSSVTRYSAHKFYLNQGMMITGYHFSMELS